MDKTRANDELIDACLQGPGDGSAVEALEAALRADPKARERYVLACHLDATLAERAGAGGAGDTAGPPDRGRTAARSDRTRLWWSCVAGGVAAAVALVAAGLGLPGSGFPGREAGGVAAPPTPLVAGTLGRVVQKINCVWDNDAWSVASTNELSEGQTLRIERGFMEVGLNNGVSIVLEGPSQFTLTGLTSGSLDYGAAAIRAPEDFAGYMVETPTARLKDLGTEFGVRVDRLGRTDLFVFEGEVAVRERANDGRELGEGDVLLRADSGWRSGGPGGGPPRENQFPNALLLEDPPIRDAPTPPVREGLRLWYAGDSSVKTDGQGRVTAWGDLSNRDASRRRSAWQVEPRRRPSLEHDPSCGVAVLRFDGNDDCLITEPLRTGDNQTVLIVGSVDMSKRLGQVGWPSGAQFINYNGPPHLVLEYRRRMRSFIARSFADYDSTLATSGRVVSSAVADKRLFSAAYVYDHQNDRAELYLNGRIHGANGAKIAVAANGPRVIGMHCRLELAALKGDIAELMVFDRALPARDLQRLFAYLDDRYGNLEIGADD